MSMGVLIHRTGEDRSDRLDETGVNGLLGHLSCPCNAAHKIDLISKLRAVLAWAEVALGATGVEG